MSNTIDFAVVDELSRASRQNLRCVPALRRALALSNQQLAAELEATADDISRLERALLPGGLADCVVAALKRLPLPTIAGQPFCESWTALLAHLPSLRREHGWTQRELGELVGVSHLDISRLERAVVDHGLLLRYQRYVLAAAERVSSGADGAVGEDLDGR